ncbi:MAG: MinD/ParA family protein [Pseudomonadota bacterium]
MHNLDQAAGIRKLSQMKPVRVLAVASGKGGVGKTNVSVNLGISLADLGRSVALLDADMGLANIDVLLGLHPQYNLSHVLRGEKALKEIMVEGPAGLRIVPGSSGIQQMSELSAMEQAAVIRAFGELDQDLDVLIVDTAAGITSGVINFARACQEVIVVICDEPTSLTDAYALIKVLSRDYGIHRFQILANMVQNAQQGQLLYTKLSRVTDRYLDVALSYFGAVPYDDSLRKSVVKQCAVVEAFPRSVSAQAFKALAKRADALPIADERAGHLEFFVERMIQYSTQGV